MSITEIEIDTEHLKKDVEMFKNLLSQLKKNQDSMERAIERLNTMWQGPANQIFNIQFRADCESFSNVCATVEAMIQAMEAARMDYEACDEQVSDLINAIRV